MVKNIIYYIFIELLGLLLKVISLFVYFIVWPFRYKVLKWAEKHFDEDEYKMFVMINGNKKWKVYFCPYFWMFCFTTGLTDKWHGLDHFLPKLKAKWYPNGVKSENTLKYFYLCYRWQAIRNAHWAFNDWFFREGEYRVTIEDISFSNEFQDKIDQMTDIIMGNKKQDEVNESLQGRIKKVLREETSIRPALNDLINMLFDGFDDIHYDWGNYMCGMGECCDPYAIGFTLPNRDYDDYIFKLVDGDNYDDDADYPKHFRDELPEVCYEMPDVRNPNFNYILFFEVFAEEIEEYLGPKRNWKYDLLNLINEKFHSKATDIIFI
jgi:hypothetical protein